MGVDLLAADGLRIAAVVLLGGTVVGFAGFGYAIVSTAILASILSPVDAVTIMIIPILAANVSLVRELDRDGLTSCVGRFWPYIAAAIAGTVFGMALLRAIPPWIFSLSLGSLTLGYVGARWSPTIAAVFGRATGSARPDASSLQVGLGLVSGFVFGASNVGVQVVAYLDSIDLERRVFVGVLALIFLGISTIRVSLAAALGFYGTGSLLWVSIGAAVVGLVGVAGGKRLRRVTSRRVQETAVSVLLTIIGARLLLAGLGYL